MSRKQRRLFLIGSGMTVLAVAVALTLNALRDSIVFFNSPSDVVSVRFEVTDGKNGIPVSYQGVLPDLFREDQGVIAEGTLDAGGTFKADTILAKHDETYMPNEASDALKRSGHWKDGYGGARGAFSLT